MICVKSFQPLCGRENEEQGYFSSAAGGGIGADTGNTWQPLEPQGPAGHTDTAGGAPPGAEEPPTPTPPEPCPK